MPGLHSTVKHQEMAVSNFCERGLRAGPGLVVIGPICEGCVSAMETAVHRILTDSQVSLTGLSLLTGATRRILTDPPPAHRIAHRNSHRGLSEKYIPHIPELARQCNS